MFLAPRHRETEGPQRSRVLPRLLVALVTAALTGLTLAPSAAGRTGHAPPAGPNVYSVYGVTGCPLERIDDQFVRCDNLTGAGVSAPSYVPESP